MSVIDDYLSTLSVTDRDLLQHVREVIKNHVPDAEEVISYQIPTFKKNGKAFGGFAAFKKHCSYFPFSGGILNKFTAELAHYGQTKSSLHFTKEKPISDDLIIRLIDAKLSENKK